MKLMNCVLSGKVHDFVVELEGIGGGGRIHLEVKALPLFFIRMCDMYENR